MPTPDTKALKQITHDFIYAAKDKNPHYKNEFYQLFRSQGAIYCIKNFEIINSSQSFKWNTNKPFHFPNGCGTLTYSGSESLDLTVKFNQTGQKLKLEKRNTKAVKKLFAEYSIQPWDKLNTPFIYHMEQLISLGHSWSHQTPTKKNINLDLENLII